MQQRTLYRMVYSIMALGLFVCPFLCLFLPQGVSGTSEFMLHLPAYQRFQCANCHVSPAPTITSHELNLFGVDFKANGATWDPVLANKNSDRDRCSNGFELGDVDGDGILDQPQTQLEHSNPGNPEDCSIAVTKKTWGIIKELFSRDTSVPQYDPFP